MRDFRNHPRKTRHVGRIYQQYGSPSRTKNSSTAGYNSHPARDRINQKTYGVVNLILWCVSLPPEYKNVRTIFIPKTGEAMKPGDFRPITISSILVRQMHSMPTTKIFLTLRVDPRQREFQSSDGYADNTIFLNLILTERQRRHANDQLAI